MVQMMRRKNTVEAKPAMKRKGERDLASEATTLGSSGAQAAKRRRGGQPAPKPGGEAPQVVKRGRGRPPSEKTLRKRAMEAKQAAEAFAAALEREQNSPVIHHGPSVDDQVRRLQQDDADAEAGLGQGRRRSSSMDRLYGRPEQTAPIGSRLRSASTADPEELKAALEDEHHTECMDGVVREEEGVSVDVLNETSAEAAIEPATGMSAPSVLPATASIQQQVPEAAAEPACPASAQAAVEETYVKEQPESRSAAAACKEPADMVAEHPSSVTAAAHVKDDSTAESEQSAVADEHAGADGQPSASYPAFSARAPIAASSRAGVKAASAPVTPATAAAEQDLTAPDATAAAFAAMGSAPALHRPSSAPTRRLERKSRPAPTPAQQASPEGSTAPAPAKEAPAKEAPPKGSPASTPAKRRSPDSTPVYIPLGKASELNGGTSSPAKRARHSPSEAAQAAPAAAGPRAAATTPAAQARAAKLIKRAKEPSKLQLDKAHRRRQARSRASLDAKQSSASPPQQPETAQAPSQLSELSAQPQGRDGLHAQASPADEQAPSTVPPELEQQASGIPPAESRARQHVLATNLAKQPSHEAAGRPAAVPLKPAPAASSAGKRGSGPMAYLLDKPRAASPTVTAITAPRPIAAMDHRLSRLTDSSQDSVLTGALQKGEGSPEALQERRQLQKQQEQDRKAREHQKVLKQIEAGLDRASTGSSFIRDMTVLVLDPAAQGLEPRIVRGILERIEQDAQMPLSATSPAVSEASSRRKVALLYVLDSALKSGKAREAKLKDKDPGLAKSMQRFCNAVAAGLPALLRATQNDPACYDKTLRVFQVWLDRGVLASKVLEPPLEQLRSHPVVVPPADAPDVLMETAKLDDFGLELANDDDSSEEGGWGDDDAAPTLRELPKLPQVEEAQKAPWLRSGGTDRAVGVTPESPEGSPWHQGPSPTYSLPGEAYPGPAGRPPGSETPPFEEQVARAPWHQPAPAERPVQTGMHLPGQPPLCAPPQLRPMYPHQMASASYLVHLPQPQAPPMSWQPRAPVTSPSSAPALLSAATGSFPQAQRQGPLHMPPQGPPPGFTLLPPAQGSQLPGMAAMQHFAQHRQPGGGSQPDMYMGFDRQGSAPGLLPSTEPDFTPPLPPGEPPPLPDEAPPPLPDEAPPPPPEGALLPEDDFDVEMADAAHLPPAQQPVQYQQPAYSHGQGW